jgi:hypothetical protein
MLRCNSGVSSITVCGVVPPSATVFTMSLEWLRLLSLSRQEAMTRLVGIDVSGE